MIAKRVMRKGKTSSYRDLANYILDRKGGGDKVRSAWSTNCAVPDDFDFSTVEIVATQELNTRSRNDKTYHLVVSLSAGEDLTDEQFKQIEQHFCNAIGLGEHQRICAIHTDTDNIHMHIALSKVHPLSLNCIEPYYDKFSLQEACRELEQEFGLKPDVGLSPKARPGPGETHQGLESFAGYIRDNLALELSKILCSPGRSWQDVQSLSGRFGLEVREHGAGLVFSHVSKKLFVKASSIDRNFSKKKMEDILGKFEASQWKGLPEKEYRLGPAYRSAKKDKLFADFQESKSLHQKARNSELSRASELRYRNIQEIKELYAERRLEVKRDTIIAKGRKRAIYQKLSLEMKKELDEVFSDAKSRRENMQSGSKSRPWLDWVHDRAKEGDETALEILRYKLPKTEDFGLGALVGQEMSHVMVSGLSRSVHRDGSIEYRGNGEILLDRGDSIILKSLNEDTVKTALLLAQAKFGEHFSPKGDEKFMQLIMQQRREPKRAQDQSLGSQDRSSKNGPRL